MVVKVVSKLPSKSAARQAQYSRQLRAEMRRVKSRKRVGHLSLLEKYLRAKSAALGQSAAPTESSAPAKSPAPSTLSGSPTPDTSSAPTAANTPSGPTSSESKRQTRCLNHSRKHLIHSNKGTLHNVLRILVLLYRVISFIFRNFEIIKCPYKFKLQE